MSKNIIIQESGQGKQFTAVKLKTNVVGGGTCLWVPEDEARLGTKYISDNGTYKASADGYYGYSEVTVNGIGTATGRDADGDDARTTTDPTTGDLITEKIIDSIGITSLPSVTSYQDGATIDFSGLVVHGYSSTGRDLGEIALSKLNIQPTVAEYDASSASSTAEAPFTEHVIPFAGTYHLQEATIDSVYDEDSSGGDAYAAWRVPWGVANLAASSSPDQTNITTTTATHVGIEKPTIKIYSTPISQSYKYDNRTVYYVSGISHFNPVQILTPPIADVGDLSAGQIAWIIIYGTKTETHSTQTITISYTNSVGETLQTSFTISVTASMGGATGGQAGETGAGRND